MSYVRGKVRDRASYSQFLDLSRLDWGLITPTDFDVVLEFQDKVFIFMEIKHVDAKPMPLGQRLAYERTCDAVASTGRKSMVLFAKHECPTEDDVPVDKLMVVNYRFNQTWREPKVPTTVRRACDIFHDRWLGIKLP